MNTELNIRDMEEADYFVALLLKQLRQEISPEELQVLENWKATHPSFARVGEQLNDGEQLLAGLLALKQVDREAWWQKISDQVETVKQPVPFYRRWYTYAVAAVLLLVAATVIWYGMPARSPERPNESKVPAVVNVQPGGNRATLTLSNGAVVNLTNAGNGKLATEGDINVVKVKDGELKYERTTDKSIGTANEGQHILTTPRGGQYSVVLPDGSRVWLNAASSIKYPTRFAANERRVTITGEVYFEVNSLPPAPSGGAFGNPPKAETEGGGAAKKVPFIVIVQSQAGKEMAKVEVLATSFNIMAYEEEAVVNTTLLKGKVKVSAIGRGLSRGQSAILKPNQQAVLKHDSGWTIHDSIDVEEVTGWKNGFVTLKNADVRTIMRMLSRWYDVDIIYQGTPPAFTFTGTLPLKDNLAVVIQVLEYAGVHLNLQQNQNKIIVGQ